MTSTYDGLVEQQADITCLLLHHVQTPLLPAARDDTVYLRGVLPIPPPAAAIRLVTGDEAAHTPDRLTAYEFPLHVNGQNLTAGDLLAILRTLTSGPHYFSSDNVTTMMGMTLVRPDPTTIASAAEALDDRALTILRCVAQPFTGERPDPLLRGFLFLEQDLLRLYLDTAERPDVLAVDVRPSGAVTALIAALPTLITEKERKVEIDTDPHCSHRMDLTFW
ncbi:hypothetical protein MXD59_06535 [Frankia sp. Ag45/Mut15]|uniref:Uncharacterized protein n=1 Tax=Frankia umida TaxID=573489 RepID=A0ABT0JV75_9ACTN|nr:hypothetical protein [Frankia umida]MCK9875438.1 hypothetical protein [Frankia umida]